MIQLSVIIPCRNESKYIAKCIESIVNQDAENCDIEILVIDGMSVDGTRAIVENICHSNRKVRLIDNTELVTPNALNLGIKNAQGDYVMIASAHSSFAPDYIDVLIKAMKQLHADVVGGYMQTAIKNDTSKARAIKEVLSCKFGVGNAMFRIGVSDEKLVDTVPFGIYRKELFGEVGGYNNNLIRNHDIELSKRLKASGKKIYLIPNAKCTYYARETFSALAKNNYGNGLWNILTVKITKRFRSLSFRHFVPMIFVLSLICPLVLMPVDIWLGLIAAASAVAYTMLTLFICVKIKAKCKDLKIRYLFAGFIALHLSYGVGSLIGLFSFHKKKIK